MAEHWSRNEVEALVADYFAMLDVELRGKPFNKTARRCALAPLLNNRSDTSIERKRQNVSAILIELGYPYVDGYKPLPNYQGLLREAVVDRITADESLVSAVEESVIAEATVPGVDDLLARWEDPPESLQPLAYPKRARERSQRIARGVSYLEMEARNRSLGLAGELFTLNYERARLIRLGCGALADAVEHVAVSQGDGLGFDIRSFEQNGHRLFRFRDDPRLFGLSGALEDTCRLNPTQFAAQVK